MVVNQVESQYTIFRLSPDQSFRRMARKDGLKLSAPGPVLSPGGYNSEFMADEVAQRLLNVCFAGQLNMTSLNRWQSVWRQLGAPESDDELFQRLVVCYLEPHRKYHTMQHLEECFAHLENVRSLAEQPGEVELALWFHDAIYNTRKKDNEERSAEWARESVLAAGLTNDRANRIYELVMATMHDAIPVGRDAEVLVDIDLAILGSDVARFDEYEVQVREEYSWVPEPLYRAARSKVLQGFANRPHIYSTEYFRTKYETRAHENIVRSLARLYA